jgi:hypothetical protein
MTKIERHVLAEALRYAEARRKRRQPGDSQLPWSEWARAGDSLNVACDALLSGASETSRPSSK